MANFLKKSKKAQNPDLVVKRLRENRVLFYGLPLTAVASVFIGLLYFILPAANTYAKSLTQNKVLDANDKNVTQSIKNLRSAVSDQTVIKQYNTTLSTYIPEDPNLGQIIEIIQKKADDYGLEKKVGAASGPSKTSIGNIASKVNANGPLFESITSGELQFQPKLLADDSKAVLMSIEVNVKGDKKSFQSFLAAMKDVKPIVNLVYVELTEVGTATAPSVNALLRFESYALKLDTTKLTANKPRIFKKDDESLYQNIPVEKFDWDKAKFQEKFGNTGQ